MNKASGWRWTGMRGLGLAVAALAGCSTVTPPSTASHVDVARYAGKWYEVSKFPVIFQRGLVAVTAEYTLRDDGSVRVFNRGLKNSFDGKESSILGVATVADKATNSKLKVRFDPFPVCLFSADYWIIEVGTDYEYAVVSNPSKKYLWILSRTPHMEQAAYDGIVVRLNAQGFETEKLELTPQP